MLFLFFPRNFCLNTSMYSMHALIFYNVENRLSQKRAKINHENLGKLILGHLVLLLYCKSNSRAEPRRRSEGSGSPNISKIERFFLNEANFE